MANWFEPKPEQIAAWEEWVETRPPAVRDAIRKHAIAPWKLYRLMSSGHRVFVYSISEPKTEGEPCTVTVSISGQFNAVAFERNVFGIAFEDLVECGLPGPDELTGSADIPIDVAIDAMKQIKRNQN